MMYRRIPAVYMRGGTSKAVFFHRNHLPVDETIRDQVILTAYGSPDPNRRQIDGMGGAVSTTSKVAIISRSEDPDYDVNYHFGQVSIDRPLIDYKGNCGNISSAVGPFAIAEGLVGAEEPITAVRIFQSNTRKLIVAEVPVRGGVHQEEGDYSIAGVPGTGGKITLRFFRPEGSITKKLLPTDAATDEIELESGKTVTVSLVDAGNPAVFVCAEDIGLCGSEIYEVDERSEIRDVLEEIRSKAAVMLGFARTPEEASAVSQAVPKVVFISRPQEYTSVTGSVIQADSIDLTARIMSMGTLHKAYAVTGAICTAGAARIPGTVVQEAMTQIPERDQPIRLGHPGGIIPVKAAVKENESRFIYEEAVLYRTARRLMEGYVCVPERAFSTEGEYHVTSESIA